MKDIIRLLPESLANQIAAGEVVQRPASVVKELMENAVDAGATQVKVLLKDAGKTLIQISDDGCGMSPTDARMCFERHATSKIGKPEDLFSIRTFGFRGEAMASIAAVAQVELKTKTADEEVGTLLSIEGSVVKQQEPVAAPNGTTIQVKNLFFNVPARRNFLKSNNAEFRHIQEEFIRVALANPEVAMELTHNEQEIFRLNSEKLARRIISILGKHYQNNLLPCQESVQHIELKGYIGRPEAAKKTRGDQFFFVNGRFIKHPYLHHAVMNAYEGLIPVEGAFPFYHLHISLDPVHVDVNVHPTKTEVKFDDESSLYALVRASVKQALAQAGAAPSLDFGYDVNFASRGGLPQTSQPSTPPPSRSHAPKPPAPDQYRQAHNLQHWESLYQKPNLDEWQDIELSPEESEMAASTQSITFSSAANELGQKPPSEQQEAPTPKLSLLLKDRYIATPVKSGLMLVDKEAAIERVVFDKLTRPTAHNAPQKLLFPQPIQLGPADMALLTDHQAEIEAMGFAFEDFGGNTLLITAVPADIPGLDEKSFIESLIEQMKMGGKAQDMPVKDRIARAFARKTAKTYLLNADQKELSTLIERLYASENPSYSPSGRKTTVMLRFDELESWFEH